MRETPLIDKETSERIQLYGANARARGEPVFNNPYLKSSAMPANTGETAEVWQAKYLAWEFGWTIEDAMRA